jgi:hypothetical protein
MSGNNNETVPDGIAAVTDRVSSPRHFTDTWVHVRPSVRDRQSTIGHRGRAAQWLSNRA